MLVQVMKRRIRAAGIHFCISAVFAALIGTWVFCVWYPPLYAEVSGGLSLFAMLVAIDALLGPALTALVLSPKKLLPELRRDITIIVLLQLLALGYGMYTIAMARPVHIVFEVDRFRVVSAADIDTAELPKASASYQNLSWTGPAVIAARTSTNAEETLRALDLAMQGVEISMMPERWTPYPPYAGAVLAKARPAALLVQKYPALVPRVQHAATKAGVKVLDLYFLPIDGRKRDGVVLLSAPDAAILEYLPVDGYFD
jgi:hypothetical protein